MNLKRKLFLSWTAVRDALAEGKVQEADLDVCLYCTSVGELIIAQVFNRAVFAQTINHMIRAAKEGRLVYCDNVEHLNDITVDAVNHMLSHNGEHSLDCSWDGTLSSLVSTVGVPTLDESPLEVLWSGQLTVEQMQANRLQQEQEDLARIGTGKQLVGTGSQWMFDLRHALARRG